MSGKNVKITMIERLLQLVAPHPCYSCGKNGPILCDYCKFNIINDRFYGCVLCGAPNSSGLCAYHNTNIALASVVGSREDALKTLIDRLKFHNAKAAAYILAELLHETLPQYSKDTIVVPIPTVRQHIRERGYDHLQLMANHFAMLRGLPCRNLLVRQTRSVQHTAKSKEERLVQAQAAFRRTHRTLDHDSDGTDDTDNRRSKNVLIIDDIITTGSTITNAAKLFDDADAVFVAALAYQPLD